MRIALIFATLLTSATAATARDPVELHPQDGKIAVIIDGQPFATYVHEGYKKPFLINIRAPDGTIVTRSLDKEAITDHPHHKGLWVAIDEVNELGHWKEAHAIRTKSAGKLINAEAKGDDPTRFHVVNEWLDAEGNPVLLEKTTVRITPDRLIAYDIELTPAGNEPVTFHDTKEGFFAIRVRDELREKGGTGQIINAQGQQGEAEAWGRKAEWVDYSGQVEGEAVGVAIFDHPDNPRPGRYHVRGYGLFAVNPFGQSAYTNGELKPNPGHLKPGETLRLRYAAWVHEGDAEQADVAARYRRYVESTQKTPASKN